MIVLAVCTEGESSEPNYISALRGVLFGTRPAGGVAVEVVTVPLGGNHGFRKIFEKADDELSLRAKNAQDVLSVLDEGDKIEKWLVVDYDKMYRHGIEEEWLRREAIEKEYRLVMNKPNFEFFVLMHFVPVGEAASVAMKDLKFRINDEIDDYNSRRGFNRSEYSALRLPSYSKNNFQTRDLFGKLLDQNTGILDRFGEESCYYDKNHYTEMWKIIERIKRLTGVHDELEK